MRVVFVGGRSVRHGAQIASAASFVLLIPCPAKSPIGSTLPLARLLEHADGTVCRCMLHHIRYGSFDRALNAANVGMKAATHTSKDFGIENPKSSEIVTTPYFVP